MSCKVCAKCKLEKEFSEFYSRRKDGRLAARCKDCAKSYAREHYRSKRELFAEYERKILDLTKGETDDKR